MSIHREPWRRIDQAFAQARSTAQQRWQRLVSRRNPRTAG